MRQLREGHERKPRRRLCAEELQRWPDPQGHAQNIHIITFKIRSLGR